MCRGPQSNPTITERSGITESARVAPLFLHHWPWWLLSWLVWAGAATAAPGPAPEPSRIPGAGPAAASGTEALSETPSGSLRIDRSTAVRLAEAHAPELLRSEAELRGATGFRAAADRLLHRPPRLELALGPRHVPGGGRLGIDASIGLFQEFSTGSYGVQLDRYATVAKQRAEANRDAVRRDARVRASLLWLDALEARELLEIRKTAVTGAKEILRIAEARVAAGRSSPGEAALARSLVGAAEAQVLHAEGAMTVADANLRHVCGIDLHRPLEIIGPLQLAPSAIDEHALRAHVRDGAPDILAARAEANAAEQSVRLGRASSRPFLDVGPSLTRESTGEWLVLAHLRMPLPGIDPAAADNAERQFQSHVARSMVGITEQAVLKDVEIAIHEREHALRMRELLRTGSIEPAERAVHEMDLQYQAGRTDLVSVITARRELYDALERWTRAATDVQRAEATLERYVASTLQQKGRPPMGAK